MFLNPPKYLAVRFIEERHTHQLFSGEAVILEHWHHKVILEYLLHFGYEEVAPGFYERQVDFAA